jgi:hypothetical protein
MAQCHTLPYMQSGLGGKLKTPSQDYVDPYIHSPLRLRGVVLNHLSTGTALPLPFLLLSQ